MTQRPPVFWPPVDLELFLLAGCPLQVLYQLGERFGYFGEVWNKPPVVAHKSQEGPNLSHGSGLRPLSNSLDFFRVSRDPFFTNHMSQVFDLLPEQITLGRF